MQYQLLTERGLQPNDNMSSMQLFYFYSKLQKDLEAKQQALLAEKQAAQRREARVAAQRRR